MSLSFLPPRVEFAIQYLAIVYVHNMQPNKTWMQRSHEVSLLDDVHGDHVQIHAQLVAGGLLRTSPKAVAGEELTRPLQEISVMDVWVAVEPTVLEVHPIVEQASYYSPLIFTNEDSRKDVPLSLTLQYEAWWIKHVMMSLRAVTLDKIFYTSKRSSKKGTTDCGEQTTRQQQSPE